MAPARPATTNSFAGPKPSLGRPKIFGGGMRRSARIEKRSTLGNKDTQKLNQEKSLGPAEADPEEKTQTQRARPEPDSAKAQSSRRAATRAYRSERCRPSTRALQNTTRLATKRDNFVDDEEEEEDDESRDLVMYHSISEGGPKLKNIAELLADTDRHQNFKIPHNKIIANEDVDRRVYQQMRRFAPSGKLTPGRVRNHLVDGIGDMESQWDLRSNRKSRPLFWKRVCMQRGWMSQLEGADCREFFLWLIVYFRHGSGKKATNKLTKAFEGLSKLFDQERDCELNELVGIELRVQPPASQAPGHARAAASRKQGSKATPEDGNIFRLSGNTNMTDYELSGVDVQGLTPVMDVGDRRKKNEERERAFEEAMEADRARMAEEAAEKAAKEHTAAMRRAAASAPQPTTQSRKQSSRKRPTPFEAGRKSSKFEEDMYEDDYEEAGQQL